MNNQQPIPLATILKGNKNENYINSVERVSWHHDIFLDDDIEAPSNYRELLALLFNAGEEDTINIYINSDGGDLDTALAIVEGLKNTQAAVTAILIGACHSAASVISMYCHQVAVLDSAYSMVHTASFGAAGSVGNVKAHTEFTVKRVEKLLNETYEGFLTKDELVKIKQGSEMWFDADEIRERINRRISHIQATEKKKTKAAERAQQKEKAGSTSTT
jgi:ATP-dependent protease ClpP protease subunit